METRTKNSPLRIFGAACIVAAGFCFMIGLYALILSNKSAANRDFISYWAAGQQLVHGANPYDRAAIMHLELAAGHEGDFTLLMRNPPVAFFLALPLGFVSAKAGIVAWSIVLLACLSVSNWIIWVVNGRPDSRFHLLGYLFAPTLACQLAGQIGVFLLLGVVLFLYLHDTRPCLAGAALLFCALKPHLFLPFFVVLTLWSMQRRKYRILAGFAAALFASCALSFYVDSHAWSQYSQMMRTSGVLSEEVPSLSVLFRLLIDRNVVWLQFLPEVCGCVWATWYFWTRRSRWNWTDQGMLLLLVSAACTPYGWFADESMLLPAVMVGLYRAVDSGRSLLPIGLFAGVALIELLTGVKVTTLFYLWTVPAWLAWYLYATASKGKQFAAAS